MPFRGTLLNTLTVIGGSLLGLFLRDALPSRIREAALIGIGLVVVGIGIKMFLESKSVIVAAFALAAGGAIGAALGFDYGLDSLAEWARQSLGAGGTFNEGLITASVLFCVGPITLLGCIQDGLERKIDLLAIKSMLDGVTSMILASTLGVGVLVSALVVLVVQGSLTALASPLKPLVKREGVLAAMNSTGGAIMLGIGITLLGLTSIRSEIFLPSLLIAPFVAYVAERVAERRSEQRVS